MTHLVSRLPSFIGFDDLFNTMDSIFEGTKNAAKTLQSTWPPYNVVKTGDKTYKISIACAGVAKNDVEIELDGKVLRVKGETKPDTSVEYLHKGIAERSFSRAFTLADSIEVKNAEMVNGMLEIILEQQSKALDNIKKIMIK